MKGLLVLLISALTPSAFATLEVGDMAPDFTTQAHHEHLVAFSCKRRGFCPSCGARRMAESAALLVDEVIPEQPIRQWVLSFP